MYEVFKILPVVMIGTKNCMLDTILYILDEIKKKTEKNSWYYKVIICITGDLVE